jgi:Amt family ammonium transporter
LIYSDPTRLRQILTNIVGNAIKFTQTGSVRIETRLLDETCDEPKLQFDVIDTGIGIPEDSIDKLFEPFTQADSSTTRRFGVTGLGLAISKRLIELLGGEITVSSTEGKGSTFTMTVSTGSLKNVRLLQSEGESTGQADRTETADRTCLNNCRILLVEDIPDIQRLIVLHLKRFGADVTIADNGQIAFEKAQAAMQAENPYHVILMDMQILIMDGNEATRRLRDAGYLGPIFALTALAMIEDRHKYFDAGCDEYITKPIDMKKLIQSIQDYSRKTIAATQKNS